MELELNAFFAILRLAIFLPLLLGLVAHFSIKAPLSISSSSRAMKGEVSQLHKDGVHKAMAKRLLQRHCCLLWVCGELQLSYVPKSRVIMKNPLIPPKNFKKYIS
jgi:hypothetical protein